jgi:hypothetical protein
MNFKNKKVGILLLEYSTYLVHLYYYLHTIGLTNGKIFNLLLEMMVIINTLIEVYLIK